MPCRPLAYARVFGVLERHSRSAGTPVRYRLGGELCVYRTCCRLRPVERPRRLALALSRDAIWRPHATAGANLAADVRKKAFEGLPTGKQCTTRRIEFS